MLRAVAQKLLMLIPVLLIVSFGTFLLLSIVPGDPVVAVLGPDATPEEYARVTQQLGLDKPFVERYFSWLGDVLHGDLGNSVIRPSTSVASLIAARLPVTIEIAVLSMGMALLIAVPLGIISAYRANSGFDRGTSGITSALISIPPFVSALLLIYLFVFNPDIPRWVVCLLLLAMAAWTAITIIGATRRGDLSRSGATWGLVVAGVIAIVAAVLFVAWPSFPRQGFDRITSGNGIWANLRTAFLPALTLALTELAVFSRLLRSDMITTLQEDYVLSARAKGMPMNRVLMRDALRPSSFSLITLAGVSLGRLLGGTVIVETIFNLPGMGRLVVQDGVVVKDFTVVQGAVLVIATMYVLINAAVDLSYYALDPRIRRGRR